MKWWRCRCQWWRQQRLQQQAVFQQTGEEKAGLSSTASAEAAHCGSCWSLTHQAHVKSKFHSHWSGVSNLFPSKSYFNEIKMDVFCDICSIVVFWHKLKRLNFLEHSENISNNNKTTVNPISSFCILDFLGAYLTLLNWRKNAIQKMLLQIQILLTIQFAYYDCLCHCITLGKSNHMPRGMCDAITLCEKVSCEFQWIWGGSWLWDQSLFAFLHNSFTLWRAPCWRALI